MDTTSTMAPPATGDSMGAMGDSMGGAPGTNTADTLVKVDSTKKM